MHETLRLPRKIYLFGNAVNGSGRYDEIGKQSSTPRLPTTNGTTSLRMREKWFSTRPDAHQLVTKTELCFIMFHHDISL